MKNEKIFRNIFSLSVGAVAVFTFFSGTAGFGKGPRTSGGGGDICSRTVESAWKNSVASLTKARGNFESLAKLSPEFECVTQKELADVPRGVFLRQEVIDLSLSGKLETLVFSGVLVGMSPGKIDVVEALRARQNLSADTLKVYLGVISQYAAKIEFNAKYCQTMGEVESAFQGESPSEIEIWDAFLKTISERCA